jgi:hypothetical protein
LPRIEKQIVAVRGKLLPILQQLLDVFERMGDGALGLNSADKVYFLTCHLNG